MKTVEGFTGQEGPYKEQIQQRREQNEATLLSMDDQGQRLSSLEEQMGGKANKATTLAGYGITNAYTKSEVDGLLNGKASKATTLAGYGITNAYTKTEVDSKFAALPQNLYLDGGSAYLSDVAQDSSGNFILDSSGNTIYLRVNVGGNNSEALVRAIEDRLAEFERRVYTLFRNAILDSDFKF